MNCRTCKGAGHVRRYAGNVFGHAHFHLVDCTDCDGTGKAKLPADKAQLQTYVAGGVRALAKEHG